MLEVWLSATIGLSYAAIPVVVVWLARRAEHLPLVWPVWLFSAFLWASGALFFAHSFFPHDLTTPALFIEALCAMVSIATVVLLPVAFRRSLRLPPDRHLAAVAEILRAEGMALRKAGKVEEALEHDWAVTQLTQVGERMVGTECALARLNDALAALKRLDNERREPDKL